MHRDAISEDCNSILRSRRAGIRAVIVTVTHDIAEPWRYPTFWASRNHLKLQHRIKKRDR